MSELAITVRTAPTGTVLHLNGELDYHSGPKVREALAALTLTPGNLLVLDLEHLTFCDSTGITTMIAARNYAHAAGTDLALAAVPANVQRILTIVGLATVLASYPSTDQALAAQTP
ncbi:STAS domain-containing protein [Streptacidiphilus sp. PAMC 29251]